MELDEALGTLEEWLGDDEMHPIRQEVDDPTCSMSMGHLARTAKAMEVVSKHLMGAAKEQAMATGEKVVEDAKVVFELIPPTEYRAVDVKAVRREYPDHPDRDDGIYVTRERKGYCKVEVL